MKRVLYRTGIFVATGFLTILVSGMVYGQAARTIRLNVSIGDLDVGGLSLDHARARLAARLQPITNNGIELRIETKKFPVKPDDIDLEYKADKAVLAAWNVGRAGGPVRRLGDLGTLLFGRVRIPLTFTMSPSKLTNQIDTIAALTDAPGRDVRLAVKDESVEILTDTELGFLLNRDDAYRAVLEAVREHASATRPLALATIVPTVDPGQTAAARGQAERIIASPLALTYDTTSFTISRQQIGEWIQSIPNGQRLEIALDEQAVSEFLTKVAQQLNAESQSPKVTVENGTVIDFIAPRTGRTLDQTNAVGEIMKTLEARKDNSRVERDDRGADDSIALVVREERPPVEDASASELGIIELIGTATTPFTGSPKNRISNIKNGARFLSGILIAPGEEFSTLKALGKIDNTTGYLPELVIKEDRTVPEFGGGLCQVSTTLFRATMNAGLPITARQNHSYRVSYYEKDKNGKFIGPGLDATIYNPAPDFRFMNDTGHHILIQGRVEGDLISFDFYGTKDGRKSEIDGPHLLSSTPAGEPIYAESDELKPGEKKQLERPHPGGSAIATYKIIYADGAEKVQEFKSFYRNWPARFLVGRDPNKPVETPAAETSAAQ